MNDKTIICYYCGAKRPLNEMVQRNLTYRTGGWQRPRFGKRKWGTIVKTEPRWYCKDTACASKSQMAHEG